MLISNKKIIDGKKIAEQIKQQIIELLNENHYTNSPRLDIFYIGNNKASELYIKYKSKFANECGVNSTVWTFDNENVCTDEIIEKIDELNNNLLVDGIMVQLPLPKANNLNQSKVLNAISNTKDVDGLSSFALGQAWKRHDNEYAYSSCTADACMKILQSINYDLKGKEAVIIGSTIVLGQPLCAMLNANGATVTICNTKTKDLKKHTLEADLIISATGIKNLITRDMIKEGVVILDVGTNKDENNKTHGDVEIDEVIDKVAYLSPSPGGVGPVTVATLILHTVLSYIEHNKGK